VKSERRFAGWCVRASRPEDVTTLAQATEGAKGSCPTEERGVGAGPIIAVRAVPPTPGPACVEALLGLCSHAGGEGTEIDVVGYSRGGAVGPVVLLWPRQRGTAVAHGIVRAGFARPFRGQIVFFFTLAVSHTARRSQGAGEQGYSPEIVENGWYASSRGKELEVHLHVLPFPDEVNGDTHLTQV